MSLPKFLSPFVLIFLLGLGGCGSSSIQYPLGSALSSGAQSSTAAQSVRQRQTPLPQRVQYIWENAMQGMVMGGSIGGLYGAGGGLLVGLLTGLFTADAQEAQLNGQIQSEQGKDKQLEAQIEQELRRQRALEDQLANSVAMASQQNQLESAPAAVKQPVFDQPAAASSETLSTVALSNKETHATASSRFKNVEVRDNNGDGVPDLWIYYDPLKPSEVIRQEEATRGDGAVNTWSYFKGGKLVRREADTKGNGTAETVYYYENDQMAREEHHENGTGQVSFRVTYQNGRRAKIEKDSTGAGKLDLSIYYDLTAENETVLKEERDLDGDGFVDVWSYYENGRLVRRDVSAVGSALLSGEDDLSSYRTDMTGTRLAQPISRD